jgi:two-component system, cell cycle sensor histidine kinase and response regulator CckA
MPRILVVDDNAIDREQVRRWLGGEYEIVEAASVHAAIARLEAGDVDCVVLDQRLPDGDGIDLLSELVLRRLPVLMLTAQGNERLAVQALKSGARDYMPKSQLSADVLRRAVAYALERNRLELELQAHQDQLAASNRALQEREAKLRVMLAQLPAIVWTTSMSLRYVSVDGAALVALGVSGVKQVGAQVRGGIPGGDGDPEAVAAHRRALAGESARYTCCWRSRMYECLVEPLRSSEGAICGVIGVALDRTEASRLEQDLRQSQKMEAVGMLAGGVAHDFNNVLTAILGFAGFLRDSLPAHDDKRADVEQVVVAANRARALVNQLLAFSRRQPIEPRVFAVNGVLGDMGAMLRRLLGEDIELCASLSPEVWNVRMDPSGLEQVIVNLCINARDAMPSGGRLTLATENLRAHDTIVLDDGQRVPAGEHVVIFVCDTGHGIAPEHRERIFEPFYTTKAVGRGTGLGLSTCLGIVTRAGGTLSARSEVGVGTTFCIYLPRSRSASDRASVAPLESVRGGRETVLVVEDDDQVRAVVARVLLGLGYRVVEAPTGRRALDLLAAGTAVDLVLTDVVMPEVGGVAVIRELQRMQPRVRFLLMSGYGDVAVEQYPAAHDHLLMKPLAPDQLARRVRAALDSGA